MVALPDWDKCWNGVACAEAGSKHLQTNPPVPCQDFANSIAPPNAPRPVAFVADGAGSARFSHLGAEEVVSRLKHLAISLEDIHQENVRCCRTYP